MEKLNLESKNIIDGNIEKIAKLFPGCITESTSEGGKLRKSIDFDKLRLELGDDVATINEGYGFNWVGKQNSVLNSNSSISSTLRPVIDKSLNWDSTSNLYIEGDNIDVLKVIQESYLESVKCIYIDPPYNTGNNIIYVNNFHVSQEDYESMGGLRDEQGNLLYKNTENNGKYHSSWCSIILPTLRLARNLLKEDGYIAIAIDDNELYSIKLMCDEVFGEMNFLGNIVTRCNPQGRNKLNVDPVHEYHLFYAKDINELKPLRILKDIDETGYRSLQRSGTNSRKEERPLRYYPFLYKDGKVQTIEKDEYLSIYSDKEFNDDNISRINSKYRKLGYEVIWPKSKNGEDKVWQRTYDRVVSELDNYIYKNGHICVPVEIDRTPVSLWSDDRYSNVSNGTNKLKDLFGGTCPFDFSKSIYTVKDMISLSTANDDIVMDFFSGSATTGHATMLLNAEDGGNRRFILVQAPEPLTDECNAFDMGFRNICEVGEKRLKLASQLPNIKENSNVDGGYRVFRLDTSNYEDVADYVGEISQETVLDNISNIKEERSAEDLLFNCLISWGVTLDRPYEELTVNDNKVINYDDGSLVACFDENVSEGTVTQIAKMKPMRVVFRDSSFADCADRINVENIFKELSPNTKVKVI